MTIDTSIGGYVRDQQDRRGPHRRTTGSRVAAPNTTHAHGRPPRLVEQSQAAAFSRPASARVHNALLGGAHTFAVDRELADRLTAVVPDLPAIARSGRAFLDRAVRYLLSVGITQVLDLGCGLLDHGSVHDILAEAAPSVRSVHVDLDPIVVEQARHTIAASSRSRHAAVVHADLRQPWTVLQHPEVGRLLDLGRPVAVIAAGVLHLLPDDPAPVLAVYREATVTGSPLVLTHPTASGRPAEMARLCGIAAGAGIPIRLRTRSAIGRLLAGYQPVPPGLVWATRWRPDPDADPTEMDTPGRCRLLGAVAVKDEPAPLPDRAPHL